MVPKQEAPHPAGKLPEPVNHQASSEKQDTVELLRESKLKTTEDFENALKAIAKRFRSEKVRTPESVELVLKQLTAFERLAGAYLNTLHSHIERDLFWIPEKIEQYRAVLKEIGAVQDASSVKTKLLGTGITDVFSGGLLKKYPLAAELFGDMVWTKDEIDTAIRKNPDVFSSIDFKAIPWWTSKDMFDMVKLAYETLPAGGIEMTNIPEKYFQDPVFINSVITLNTRIFRWAQRKFDRNDLSRILIGSPDMSISRLYNLMKDKSLIRDRNFMMEACTNHPHLLQSMYGNSDAIKPGTKDYDQDQAQFRKVLFDLDFHPIELASRLNPEAFTEVLLHRSTKGIAPSEVSSINWSFNASGYDSRQRDALRFQLYAYFSPEVFFRDLYRGTSNSCSLFNDKAIAHTMKEYSRAHWGKGGIGEFSFFPTDDSFREHAVSISLNEWIPFGMELLTPSLWRDEPLVKRLLAYPKFSGKKELQTVLRQMGKVDHSHFSEDVLSGKTDPGLYNMEKVLEQPSGVMQIFDVLNKLPQSFRYMNFTHKCQENGFYPAILRAAVIADLSNFLHLPNVWERWKKLFSQKELQDLARQSLRDPKSKLTVEDILAILPYSSHSELYNDGVIACGIIHKEFMKFSSLPLELQKNEKVVQSLFSAFMRTCPTNRDGQIGCLIGVLSTLGQERNELLFKWAWDLYVLPKTDLAARENLITNPIFIRFVRNMGVDADGKQIDSNMMKECREEVFSRNLDGYYVVQKKQDELHSDSENDAWVRQGALVEQLRKKWYTERQSESIAKLVLSIPMKEHDFVRAFKALLNELGLDRSKNSAEIDKLIQSIAELQLAEYTVKSQKLRTSLADHFSGIPALHQFLLPAKPGEKSRAMNETALDEVMSSAYREAIERAEEAKGSRLTEKERKSLKQEAVRIFSEKYGIREEKVIRSIEQYFANKKDIADISKIVAKPETIALERKRLTGEISQADYEAKSERLYAELESKGELPITKTAFDTGKKETMPDRSGYPDGKPNESMDGTKGITAPSFSELSKNHDKLPYDRPIKVEGSDVTVYRTDRDSFEVCQSLNGDRTFRLKVPSSRIESATGSLAYLKDLGISELGETAVTEMVRAIHESVPGIRIDFSQDLSHSDATMGRRVLLQSVAKLIGIPHPEGYSEEDLVRTLRQRIRNGNGLIAVLRNRSDSQPVTDPSGNVIPLVSGMTVSPQAIRLALKSQ